MNETKKENRLPKVLACLLLITFFCGGCSTELSHGFDDSIGCPKGVYRGTRLDGACLLSPIIIPLSPERSEIMAVGSSPGAIAADVFTVTVLVGFGAADLPLSLTADTLMFPYDLKTIHHKNSDKETTQ